MGQAVAKALPLVVRSAEMFLNISAIPSGQSRTCIAYRDHCPGSVMCRKAQWQPKSRQTAFYRACTCGLNTGGTHPRIAAGFGPAPYDVASSLQNVQAARRDELARPKSVESMGDQYCDTESDQKACNNRPHERSPRHHRLRRARACTVKTNLEHRRELPGADDFEQQKRDRSPTQ
jgi:hypothetical protein